MARLSNVLLVAAAALLLVAASVNAKVYFKEEFDKTWEDRWVHSNWKQNDGTAGKFVRTAGEWYGDAEADKGIKTSTDARFYAISAPISEAFSNRDKTLVFQFQVRHTQKIDCGGGYIKLLPSSVKAESFDNNSPYFIMFGPDICGTTTKRVHSIFNFKGDNLLTKKEVRAETDQLSHVYTLIVNPDDTYEIRVDGEKKAGGSLFEDWDFRAAKEIKDPSAKKPADWVDQAEIDDPTDTKPADWDAEPKEIADPEAEKPEDWDVEDGEWEAPMVPNPKYKGEWKAKRIPNPAYKGAWVHPMIPNPDYVEHTKVAQFEDIGRVGIEIWQVKAGTIFDNIIVTDDVKEAEDFLAATYTKGKAAEKALFDEVEAAERKKEDETRQRVEEERKKQDDAKKGGDADDEDDEEDDEDEDDEVADKIKSKVHDEL